MDQAELKSHEQNQIFSYDVMTEQEAVLHDENGRRFSVTFALSKTQANDSPVPSVTERAGKRLLVGRYCLVNNRPAYVRGLTGGQVVDVIETFSKRERKIDVKDISLLETSGVNVFKLDQEPDLIRQCQYEWILELKVKEKRMLNQIMSKIQIRQAYLQNKQ